MHLISNSFEYNLFCHPIPQLARRVLICFLFQQDVNRTWDMSPKYVINHKNVKRESYEAKNGGKTPKWDQWFTFNVGSDMETAGVM